MKKFLNTLYVTTQGAYLNVDCLQRFGSGLPNYYVAPRAGAWIACRRQVRHWRKT
jgi:hypothetical protein